MRHHYSKRKRFLLFFLGMVIAGFGVSLSTRPGLGASPISSFPYVCTYIIPWTLGMCSVALNLLFILLQIIIKGKRYQWRNLGQILTLIGFGSCIDLGWWISSFYVPNNYFLCLLEILLDNFLLALGVGFQLVADVSYMPGDGFIQVVSEEYGFKFGVVKICFDTTMVISSIILSLIFFGTIYGVREGTIISAFLVGFLIKHLQAPLRHLKGLLLK